MYKAAMAIAADLTSFQGKIERAIANALASAKFPELRDALNQMANYLIKHMPDMIDGILEVANWIRKKFFGGDVAAESAEKISGGMGAISLPLVEALKSRASEEGLEGSKIPQSPLELARTIQEKMEADRPRESAKMLEKFGENFGASIEGYTSMTSAEKMKTMIPTLLARIGSDETGGRDIDELRVFLDEYTKAVRNKDWKHIENIIKAQMGEKTRIEIILKDYQKAGE
jgi:hypothetical protein